MATSEKQLQTLMMLVENGRGFVLGEKLINLSETMLTTFEDTWMEREKNGITRSALEVALSTTEKVSSDVSSFAEDWLLLQMQVGEPDSSVETTDEQYFTLNISKAKRPFRFPYCCTAMSTCNWLIQHYSKA